jgi:tetratricopeptide (TPR) repeat protein
MWGEAQRLGAAALIESGRSADGDARAAWALGPEFAATLSLPIRATLLAVRVRGLVDLGRQADALAVAHEATEVAKSSGVLDASLRALDARLFACLNMGDPSEAIATGAQLIEAAESAGDVVLACRARTNTSSALNQVGMFEEAQALLERSLVDTRARRLRILEAFALHNLGMSMARLGNLDQGIEFQRLAGQIADETGAARLRIHARVYEANLLVWRNGAQDVAAAQGIARWLVEETKNRASLHWNSLFTLARVQLARGAVEAAIELARDACQYLASGPVEEWEELCRLVLVQALLHADEPDEADQVLGTAFDAIVARAHRIKRPDHRQAYLGRNAEVVELVQLAQARLGRTLPQFPTSYEPSPYGPK